MVLPQTETIILILLVTGDKQPQNCRFARAFYLRALHLGACPGNRLSVIPYSDIFLSENTSKTIVV